jgi:hypothetical protein
MPAPPDSKPCRDRHQPRSQYLYKTISPPSSTTSSPSSTSMKDQFFDPGTLLPLRTPAWKPPGARNSPDRRQAAITSRHHRRPYTFSRAASRQPHSASTAKSADHHHDLHGRPAIRWRLRPSRDSASLERDPYQRRTTMPPGIESKLHPSTTRRLRAAPRSQIRTGSLGSDRQTRSPAPSDIFVATTTLFPPEARHSVYFQFPTFWDAVRITSRKPSARVAPGNQKPHIKVDRLHSVVESTRQLHRPPHLRSW